MEPIDPTPLEEIMTRAGVVTWGVTDAALLTPVHDSRFSQWLSSGRHAAMQYMERYGDVRAHPAQLLEGATSVVSCAFSYLHPGDYPAGIPYIARYARGRDYHEVVREQLETVAQYIKDTWGGLTRVCVDTAPLHERHRAVMAGIGFTGRNGLLIVPQYGSWVVLGEIITTAHLQPSDNSCRPSAVAATLPATAAAAIGGDACLGCDRCVKACPGGALDGTGAVDARRCLSYLTIEHRGDFDDDFSTGGRLVGCDTCQAVCPHNTAAAFSTVDEFKPREAYSHLNQAHIASMEQPGFSTMFSHSAIKRLKLEGLKRNAAHL